MAKIQVATNQSGLKLNNRLNEIVEASESAIVNLKKIGYTFPNLNSDTQSEIDRNELVKIIKQSKEQMDEAFKEYKLRFDLFLVALAEKEG